MLYGFFNWGTLFDFYRSLRNLITTIMFSYRNLVVVKTLSTFVPASGRLPCTLHFATGGREKPRPPSGGNQKDTPTQ